MAKGGSNMIKDLYRAHLGMPLAVSCRVCGCTEDHACTDDRGERDNCSWAAPSLCSYCADAIKQLMPLLQQVIDMRNMQKQYFKTRSQAVLTESKSREKRLDATMKEVLP